MDDFLNGEVANLDDPPKGLLAAILWLAAEDLRSGKPCTFLLCHDVHECCADAAELLTGEDAETIEDIVGFTHGASAYYTRVEIAKMDVGDYQKRALSTAATTEKWEDRIVIAALGISGEAGEIAELLKKWKGQGHDLNQNRIIEELGDVLWYVAYFCEALGTSLEVVMLKNIEKLKRRYPSGVFEASRSIERGAGHS